MEIIIEKFRRKLNYTTLGFTRSGVLCSRADLSRRAIVYTMQGLSYREYLNLELGLNLKEYSLDEIILNHI